MDKIQTLLSQISLLSKKNNEILEIMGTRFNIFHILGVSHYENTHSTILAELLNPEGTHGLHNSFLKLFLDINQIEGFDSRNALVRTEVAVSEYGRIDILIESSNWAVIIENKFYAKDQPEQLKRYNEYAIGKYGVGNYMILYLTPDGRYASDDSGRGVDYRCISYKKNKHLYIKESEARYVKRAFELYRDGKDTQYIADMFNANGVPLKSGRTDIVWVKGTISQILNNTAYYGKGKRTAIVKKATLDSPAEKKVSYFDTPSIISKELFDECRKIAKANRSRQDKSKSIVCILRGLLKCGRCGRFYVLGNNNKQREYRDGDLRANINQRLGCKNGSIKADIADNLVWKAIQGIYKYEKFKEKCLAEKEKYKKEIASNNNAMLNIEKDLKQLDNQSENLVKFAIKGLLSEDEFAKQKQSLDSEKARKNNMLDELKASNFFLQRKIDAEFDYSVLSGTFNLSQDEKKQICNDLIDNVLIYGYGAYKKMLQVNLKMDLTYNILINTHHVINSYCIFNDEVVTFCDPFNNKSVLKGMNLNVGISDFEVTSNNNELFDTDVFGGYSFDEMWNIMNRYGYISKIESEE